MTFTSLDHPSFTTSFSFFSFESGQSDFGGVRRSGGVVSSFSSTIFSSSGHPSQISSLKSLVAPTKS